MIRVYTASKLTRAPLWQTLCSSWPHVYFHARWLKHVSIGTPDTPDNAASFWQEDEQDVRCADVVVVFAQNDEHLRGALVEAGMALAMKIPVIVIGDHKDYGTWQYHPGVTRLKDLEELRGHLELLAK
jgi:nucleoside 2-deoxyribosyltransferase